jgi:tyrosyl-tRNA synthetase
VAGVAPDGDASTTVYAGDGLNRILAKCGLAESGSEATRKIKQGGVKIDGVKVADFGWKVPGPGTYLLQVGARQFVKLVQR